jgi:hypothetical protein
VRLLDELGVGIVNYDGKRFGCAEGAMCVCCCGEAKEQSNAYEPEKNLLL